MWQGPAPPLSAVLVKGDRLFLLFILFLLLLLLLLLITTYNITSQHPDATLDMPRATEALVRYVLRAPLGNHPLLETQEDPLFNNLLMNRNNQKHPLSGQGREVWGVGGRGRGRIGELGVIE